MVDRLDGVSTFVEVVDAGGFSAAAQRLNLSRSAVGKTVARLEQRLGVRLFHRTTRSQALTEPGQAFHAHCLKALGEIRAGESLIESGRREVAGRLRVTMPVLFGRRCVAPILTGLARLHPKLTLDLSFSDRLADLVEDGFDLAVRNGPPGENNGLMVRRIGAQRMTVCAAPAYLEARGVPASLEDLRHHDAVAYGRGGRIVPWEFPAPKGPDIVLIPETRVRLDDLDAIADAAADGMGLAWLPCWLIKDRVRSGSLVTLFGDRPRRSIDVHALWANTPSMPLRIRAAIDALAGTVPNEMMSSDR